MPKGWMRTRALLCVTAQATSWPLCSYALLNRLSAPIAEYLATFGGNVFNPTKVQPWLLEGGKENRKRWGFISRKNKTPVCVSRQGFRNSILTMTYSHMGKPHTTIGDASFHY